MQPITKTHLDAILSSKIKFNFVAYLTQGFRFYKDNFSQVFLSGFIVSLIGGIPIIGWVATANLYKVFYNIENGDIAPINDLFNFDRWLEITKFFFVANFGGDNLFYTYNFNFCGISKFYRKHG